MATKKVTNLSREVRMRKAGKRQGEAEKQGRQDSSRGASVTDPRQAHADAKRVQRALDKSDPSKIERN
jgi:hypothetical protein